MAKIRVIQGGCGVSYKDANGVDRYACRTAESGAFECDDVLAERFVHMGVAEYVASDGQADKKVLNDMPDGKTNVTGAQKRTQEAGRLGKLEYNELKKLAAEMGLEPRSQKKADLIAAISEADEGETDELPQLKAADPE